MVNAYSHTLKTVNGFAITADNCSVFFDEKSIKMSTFECCAGVVKINDSLLLPDVFEAGLAVGYLSVGG